jgi:hypothetical protein
MANRVLLGNRATGGYGAYVSKAGHNVLTCARKELLMDSSQKRAGEVYAGGTQSSLGNSGQNFLSTGSKSSLGYIPLVIHTEDKRGEYETNAGGDENYWTERMDAIETTVNTIRPVNIGTEVDNNTSNIETLGVVNRINANSCTNIKFMVLKIPCAYGYMTSANFDS